MRLLFLNPNSTEAMTESIAEAARAAAPPGVEVLCWTNVKGPPAIQGPEDGAAAAAGLNDLLPAAKEAQADVLIIACFDDTGLTEIRAAAHCPVIGIGQAAFHMATLVGHRFSVVTTLPVSVPVIEANIHAYGFAQGCGRIRASGIPVLDVEAGGLAVADRLAAEILAAEHEDNVGAVVLGCSGMARLASALQARTSLDVIDGVAAATRLAPALVW